VKLLKHIGPPLPVGRWDETTWTNSPTELVPENNPNTIGTPKSTNHPSVQEAIGQSKRANELICSPSPIPYGSNPRIERPTPSLKKTTPFQSSKPRTLGWETKAITQYTKLGERNHRKEPSEHPSARRDWIITDTAHGIDYQHPNYPLLPKRIGFNTQIDSDHSRP